jgi:hypothetical protein
MSEERTEVHHYQHSDPEPDERMVSVELTQGQSGKRGVTVKAYGPDVVTAAQRAGSAFDRAIEYIGAAE